MIFSVSWRSFLLTIRQGRSDVRQSILPPLEKNSSIPPRLVWRPFTPFERELLTSDVIAPHAVEPRCSIPTSSGEARRGAAAAANLAPPPPKVLLRFFETLYFASLKTDEGRPCRCTVNYVYREEFPRGVSGRHPSGRWAVVPFEQTLPFDAHTLTKLAEAADPSASSLAVSSDGEALFIWGMVDQEMRYADYVAMDSTADPQRPGLFQATITGVGSISAYKDYELLGSLEQDNLNQQFHDVMWSGPVYEMLRGNLRATLADDPAAYESQTTEVAQVEKELLARWQNAVCRVLLHMQQYRHGGGLLIVPHCPAENVNVKYAFTYDRLPKALVALAHHQLLKRHAAEMIAQHCRSRDDLLPCAHHFDAVANREKLDEHKSEVLGSVRFIAGLSRVDGVVLLDKSLVVHGFGVELRAVSDLTETFIAGDPQAAPRLLRKASLSQFGTRHRAMLRYCYQHSGALGFVVSQDGDIQAAVKVANRLILWENINVQLAFKAENRGGAISNLDSMMNLLQFWMHSAANLGTL